MFAFVTKRRGLAPVALAVAVACALAACKKEQAPADAAATGPAAQQAPAPTPQSVVSASVAAMAPDQLRAEASKAYAENRLYAPAGNNAMEYYLALRDKLPGDAGASSALTDLLPMTVIATEQGIAREDFAEAKRLTALIEKAEPSHPALGRLKGSIASSETAAATRVQQQQLTAEQDAQRQADLARQREEDQRRLQEQQRQQAAQQQAAQQAEERQRQQQQQAAAAPPAQPAAPSPSQQQAATQPAAASSRPASGSSPLRALSQPGPRYPQQAQRAGVSGNVQVEFTVTPDGSVSDVRVLDSDAPRAYQRDFEREALAAVKRWRFAPPDAPVTTRRTISFQL